MVISNNSLKPTITRFVFFIFLSIFFLVMAQFSFACDGCLDSEEECFEYGMRIDGDFCSLDGDFVEQKYNAAYCDNDFECESNLCLESRCISISFFQRLFIWFRNTFLS